MDVSRYPRPGVLAGVLFVAGLVFLFGFVHALKSSGFTDVREGCMAPAIPAKEAASMGGAIAHCRRAAGCSRA